MKPFLATLIEHVGPDATCDLCPLPIDKAVERFAAGLREQEPATCCPECIERMNLVINARLMNAEAGS